jgi:putative oxidoreductase
MAGQRSSCHPWSLYFLRVLRIIPAFLFMEHGAQKLFSFPAPTSHAFPFFSNRGSWGVAIIRWISIDFGLFTRPVAFLLSGEMAVAYFMAHAPHGFWPLLNRGELAVLYCLVFLYLDVGGGGSWSVDRLRRRKAL